MLAILASIIVTVIKFELKLKFNKDEVFSDQISTICFIIYLLLHFTIIKNSLLKFFTISTCFGYFVIRSALNEGNELY